VRQVHISRAQYKSLLDILLLLPPNSTIERLPNTLDTLKRRLHGLLPQLPLRQSPVKLVPDKLATMAESRKQKAVELGPAFHAYGMAVLCEFESALHRNVTIRP